MLGFNLFYNYLCIIIKTRNKMNTTQTTNDLKAIYDMALVKYNEASDVCRIASKATAASSRKAVERAFSNYGIAYDNLKSAKLNLEVQK